MPIGLTILLIAIAAMGLIVLIAYLIANGSEATSRKEFYKKEKIKEELINRERQRMKNRKKEYYPMKEFIRLSRSKEDQKLLEEDSTLAYDVLDVINNYRKKPQTIIRNKPERLTTAKKKEMYDHMVENIDDGEYKDYFQMKSDEMSIRMNKSKAPTNIIDIDTPTNSDKQSSWSKEFDALMEREYQRYIDRDDNKEYTIDEFMKIERPNHDQKLLEEKTGFKSLAVIKINKFSEKIRTRKSVDEAWDSLNKKDEKLYEDYYIFDSPSQQQKNKERVLQEPYLDEFGFDHGMDEAEFQDMLTDDELAEYNERETEEEYEDWQDDVFDY